MHNRTVDLRPSHQMGFFTELHGGTFCGLPIGKEVPELPKQASYRSETRDASTACRGASSVLVRKKCNADHPGVPQVRLPACEHPCYRFGAKPRKTMRLAALRA